MATEIIMKKVQRCLNAESSSLLFGDVRSQMKRDLLNSLEAVVNKKSSYSEPYWILVYANLDAGIKGHKAIKEKIMILPVPPQTKYLGSLLFKVDNKLADATLEWCLPLDMPVPSELRTEREKGSERILVDAQGLPIFNRTVH